MHELEIQGNERLAAAVIGCGRMGAGFGRRSDAELPFNWLPIAHAEAIQTTPGLYLSALADTDIGRLKHAADRFKVEYSFTEPSVLLATVPLDIVAIATRTPDRPHLIEAVIKAGVKGLHLEKPFGRSIAEVCRLIQLAESTGVSITYGATRRYMPIYALARELVRGGQIGDLREVSMEMGRGTLFWTHPHSTDILLYFADGAAVSDAQANCAIPADAVEGLVVDCDPVVESATVRFTNGVVGHIGQTGCFNVRLGGSAGTITIRNDGCVLELDRSNTTSGYFIDRKSIFPTPGMSGTQQAFSNLVKAVTTEQPLDYSHIEEGMLLLMAIVWSSLSHGRRIRLDEVPHELIVTGRTGQFFA